MIEEEINITLKEKKIIFVDKTESKINETFL